MIAKYCLSFIQGRFSWFLMFFVRKIYCKFQLVSTNLLWDVGYWLTPINQFPKLKTKFLLIILSVWIVATKFTSPKLYKTKFSNMLTEHLNIIVDENRWEK